MAVKSKIEITGGPHAKNTKITVDGEEVPGIYHAEVILDVNDAVRVKMEHFMTAAVSVSGTIEKSYKVAIYRARMIEAIGDTISDALHHAAELLAGAE